MCGGMFGVGGGELGGVRGEIVPGCTRRGLRERSRSGSKNVSGHDGRAIGGIVQRELMTSKRRDTHNELVRDITHEQRQRLCLKSVTKVCPALPELRFIFVVRFRRASSIRHGDHQGRSFGAGDVSRNWLHGRQAI